MLMRCIKQRHEIRSHETRYSTLSYGENPVSLSPELGSVLGRDTRTDRQTDTWTDGGTELR